MSNEYKDWLWDKLPEVLFDAGVIDKAIQIIPDFSYECGVVHGIKDGYHVKYTVWFDDDDGYWRYERSED